MRVTAGCSNVFLFFQGTWVYRRLYRLGSLMSTVFLGLQRFVFFYCHSSLMLGLISASQHQRCWRKGTWTLLTSERCHVANKKKRKEAKQKRSKSVKQRHGVKISRAQPWVTCFLSFLHEWIVTTTPWRTWTEKWGEEQQSWKQKENWVCIYQLTPIVQYILLKRTMRFC